MTWQFLLLLLVVKCLAFRFSAVAGALLGIVHAAFCNVRHVMNVGTACEPCLACRRKGKLPPKVAGQKVKKIGLGMILVPSFDLAFHRCGEEIKKHQTTALPFATSTTSSEFVASRCHGTRRQGRSDGSAAVAQI